MITPDEIKAKALRLWESRRLLQAEFDGTSLFPFDIPFRKPAGGHLIDDFAAVAAWIAALRAGSRERLGYGFQVEFARVHNRKVGEQSLPARIYFQDRGDFLRFIDRDREFADFQRTCAFILNRRPVLRDWLARNTGRVLAFTGDWERLLDVCDFLFANPTPGVYLRELALPGVDTKFVESRRGILAELLDELLPALSVRSEYRGLAGHNFERRYGFRFDQPQIRFRLLDRTLERRFGGLSDLSLPVADFARLEPIARRVFITENKLNGLAFPPLSDALIIFGLGYGIQSLRAVTWLRECAVRYWGDLDTHGFRMLALLREFLPGTVSLLMDERTMFAFREFWGREGPADRFLSDLPELTAEERRVYDSLRSDEYGECIRLEQERIGWDWVRERLAEIDDATASA